MSPENPPRRRRLLVPEVVQTSQMDCGPASLTSLLGGFGVQVSYGRLREACQTDVDGTSIDTIEEAAVQLGLDAEQIVIPVDHLLLPEARALPALLVVRLPNGFTHFVVVWERRGPLVQVMDPASGRRWTTVRRLLAEAYVHAMTVPAAAWREWAGSEDAAGAFTARLRQLGVQADAAERLVRDALADPGWRPVAALDAAARMVAALVRSGGAPAGPAAARLVEALAARARDGGEEVVPEVYWSVRSVPPDEEGERLWLRGAVLVRVKGRKDGPGVGIGEAERGLSPELVAALEEPPIRPERELWTMLRAEGGVPLAALLAGLVFGAGAVMVQGLLFRGLVDLGRMIGSAQERLGAMGVALALVLALLLIELPVAFGLRRLGRGLETRLRIAFLEALPRLNDRYFSSRPTSDMAHRGHELHLLRLLPELAGRAGRSGFELLATTAGLVWLAPESAPKALLAAVVCLVLPLVTQPFLSQWDLRMRTHDGGLARFYLDSLLGLMAIRTHGAERSVRREHESLLVEWSRASLGFQAVGVVVEGVQSFLGFGLAVWLLWGHLVHVGQGGGILLLAYWALNLPVLGQEVVGVAREYPALRNVTLRLLEPLGAREATTPEPPAVPVTGQEVEPPGVALSLRKVSVRATGHTLLSELDLELPAGGHVAVVGPSGAGKSSLAGLLLGWHRPAEGELLVDGRSLDREHLARLLPRVAWVDPAAQLWNRALLPNLQYGAPEHDGPALGEVLHQSDLISLLEHLPEGLQTTLGEGGALVSGGEGQRVRLGRAMLRRQARLVILDEPFRGLDRDKRHLLLTRARALWKDATLLCITHDVKETLAFQRVLVIEGGRIVEDGVPAELAAREGSRYRALHDAEALARQTLWGAPEWRRLEISRGRVEEVPKP